jgi:hypothetical protein
MDWKKSDGFEVDFFDRNEINFCQLLSTNLQKVHNFIRIERAAVKIDFFQIFKL